MPRLLQFLALSFTVSLLSAVALVPGCADECSRVDDCDHGEVCYKGVCTPLSADYVRCDTNTDCSANGDFLCRAGRCVIRPTGPVVLPDSGVHPDAAELDSGIHPDASFPDAMTFPDAEVADTGTSTSADSGM
jgi:hypothetical protein